MCSRALADLGADVIKVEPPEGDPARYAGPFPNDQPHIEKSGRFLSLNVNKRGITLDADSSSDRDALLDLVREADVFVTDFRPPQLRERKVEFPELSAMNSRLVMAAISPFGQTGPYRDFKGGELIAWHAGGLGYETPAHAVTDPDSQPPLKLAGQQAMHLSGWAAATGVMLALADRDSTGKGQLVDVSSMEGDRQHHPRVVDPSPLRREPGRPDTRKSRFLRVADVSVQGRLRIDLPVPGTMVEDADRGSWRAAGTEGSRLRRRRRTSLECHGTGSPHHILVHAVHKGRALRHLHSPAPSVLSGQLDAGGHRLTAIRRPRVFRHPGPSGRRTRHAPRTHHPAGRGRTPASPAGADARRE